MQNWPEAQVYNGILHLNLEIAKQNKDRSLKVCGSAANNLFGF